jgi:hypothetical protein
MSATPHSNSFAVGFVWLVPSLLLLGLSLMDIAGRLPQRFVSLSIILAALVFLFFAWRRVRGGSRVALIVIATATVILAYRSVLETF